MLAIFYSSFLNINFHPMKPKQDFKTVTYCFLQAGPGIKPPDIGARGGHLDVYGHDDDHNDNHNNDIGDI